VIWCGFDQLFSQFHFVAAIAIKRTANQHVARQFHLVDHAYLGKAGIAALINGRVYSTLDLRRVRRSPGNTVDTQQTQNRPGWVFRQIGIYSPLGQLYEPEDAGSMLYYREARDG
jgi:hypothetical protein